MKRFLINVIIFSVVPLILYILFYWVYDYFTLPKGNTNCYVWGDSQMFQDVDLTYLDSNSSYRYISSAAHGAGVYDFLVFSEIVPEGSPVLIQISRPALLREKNRDRNMSLLNLRSLYELIINGYSSDEISSIVRRNIIPNKLFYTKNYLAPNADTIVMAEPISALQPTYDKMPDYLKSKENLYLKGIQTLIHKKCKIIAIVFPFHPVLNAIVDNCVYADELRRFDNEVGGYFDRKEVIEIDSKENIFVDLSHLNERGGTYLTQQLAPLLKFESTPMLVKVKTK